MSSLVFSPSASGINTYFDSSRLVSNLSQSFDYKVIQISEWIQPYVDVCMAESIVEEQEDQQFFATVPELFGVWGLGSSISEARDDLQDSVYDWLLLKIEDADQDIPPKGGIDLNRL